MIGPFHLLVVGGGFGASIRMVAPIPPRKAQADHTHRDISPVPPIGHQAQNKTEQEDAEKDECQKRFFIFSVGGLHQPVQYGGLLFDQILVGFFAAIFS